MESHLREEFRKSARALFRDMSEEQIDAFVEEGERLNAGARRAKAYELKSRAQPDKPVLYSERPPGMKFAEFMRREYVDKGILTPDFTLVSLRNIDPDLAQAYSNQVLRKELPADITIRKERARLNWRERQAKAATKP